MAWQGFVRLFAATLLLCAFAAESATRAEYCRVARDADFEGAGRDALQSYADALTTRSSAGIRQVSVAIVKGPPKPGFNGVTAGEVGCHRDDRFRITLYRDALAGRPLRTAYNTVAHEFHHLVQIERDRLPCSPRSSGDLPGYEREAAAVADRLVPPCK